MIIKALPASTGWLWIKQGFEFYRRRPFDFSMLFLGYLFATLLIGSIPIAGQLLIFILLPFSTLPFMQACKDIEAGKTAPISLLLCGFRSPQVVSLFWLGLCYLVGLGIAISLSTLIDGGLFWQAMSGQKELTPEMAQDPKIAMDLSLAMLFTMLIYIPALMAFWFAGPLIAWQKMPVTKALFYSFFASIRHTKAFLMYGVAWFVVGGLIPAIISVIIAAVLNTPNAALLIISMLSMLSTIIFYCSFYPNYQSVFGQAFDAARDAEPESTIS